MTDHRRGAPRTLLELLVRERNWSYQDFCDAYARTARELDLTLSVSPQHAGRWFGAKLKGTPYPSQCRVLERMFGVDVPALLSPPEVARGAARRRRDRADPVSEVALAADESARFAGVMEQTNVGPHTIDQFHADIARLVAVYPNRPVYPSFVELRALRDRAFEKLEGRQFPAQTRELYLVAGALTGVLSNASFDLGRLDAAETQARTAFLCAELAGSNWLRAWVRGTQALIAYWDGRPDQAVRLTNDGCRYPPESGTAAVRLASIAARAHGAMRDDGEVSAALARADPARAGVVAGDALGGMMDFPLGKQRFYASTARLWLGSSPAVHQAQRDAEQAVELYEDEPPERRRLGELSLARLDLAAARLGTGDADGVEQQVRPVLAVVRKRPTDSVLRRLRQVHAVLARSSYAHSRGITAVRDEVRSVIDRAAVPALPEAERSA